MRGVRRILGGMEMCVRVDGRDGWRMHVRTGMQSVRRRRHGRVVLVTGHAASLRLSRVSASARRVDARRCRLVHRCMPVHGRHVWIVVWSWSRSIAVELRGRRWVMVVRRRSWTGIRRVRA